MGFILCQGRRRACEKTTTKCLGSRRRGLLIGRTHLSQRTFRDFKRELGSGDHEGHSGIPDKTNATIHFGKPSESDFATGVREHDGSCG